MLTGPDTGSSEDEAPEGVEISLLLFICFSPQDSLVGFSAHFSFRALGMLPDVSADVMDGRELVERLSENRVSTIGIPQLERQEQEHFKGRNEVKWCSATQSPIY